MNFARGILESRNVTYYKSVRRLAKPLPLDTPTIIELSPENKIRVTLLDANHCVGAVMFLIEGEGKAILYTGDIRAETWWVNSIIQNPVLLPYTCGTRRLDCVYLDTTFATKSEPYREFPSKADGIRELLERVAKYPEGTIFYFHSWTFGYENVWIALSNFLKSQIHLDPYRHRIYGSLTSLKNKQLKESGHDIREAPALYGFMNGNHFQPGCLTSRYDVRIHSCESGMGCPLMDGDTNSKVVRIIPIITRSNGAEIAEIGAGGGKGDLDQKEELETGDVVEVGKLMELCAEKIEDAELLSKVLAILQRSLSDGSGNIELGQGIQKESQGDEDNISLPTLVSVLSNRVEEPAEELLNETIRFPYSRHSSYSELCTLINALKPKDVYPCTVDDETWNPNVSMRSLFGQFCSGGHFRHDDEMKEVYELRTEREREKKCDAETQASQEDSEINSPVAAKRARLVSPGNGLADESEHFEEARSEISPQQSAVKPSSFLGLDGPTSSPPPAANADHHVEGQRKSRIIGTGSISISNTRGNAESNPSPVPRRTYSSGTSTESTTPSQERRTLTYNKRLAYNAVLGFGLTWDDFGGLVSTRKRGQDEVEL
jgi:hypothetical protein